MSWTEQQKTQFQVALIWDSVEAGTPFRQALKNRGFSAYLLPDEDVLLAQAETDLPHLLIVNPAALGCPVELLMQKLEKISPEVQVICWGSAPPGAVRQANFAGSVANEAALILQTELCLQRVFLSFQNEQLFSDLARSKAQLTESIQKIEHLKKEPAIGFYLPEEVQIFSTAETREDLIHHFFERARDLTSPRLGGLFLKHFKSQNALIPVHVFGLDPQKLKGLGIPLKGQKDLQSSEPLKGFLKDVLRVRQFWSFPIQALQEFEGHLVVWADEKITLSLVENLVQALQLVMDQKLAYKMKEESSVLDVQTGLLSETQWDSKLHLEIARAQRLQSPLTVLLARIDHLDLKNEVEADALFQKIAELLRTTSRPYDLIFRKSREEFCILMPHATGHAGRLRAERLRAGLEKKSRQSWGMDLSVSVGVSEYPSLSAVGNSLLIDAERALKAAVQEGGNRVRVAERIVASSPDFVAPTL